MLNSKSSFAISKLYVLFISSISSLATLELIENLPNSYILANSPTISALSESISPNLTSFNGLGSVTKSYIMALVFPLDGLSTLPRR